MKKILATMTLLLAMTSACGNKDDDEGSSTRHNGYSSGNCSYEVISDYNSIVSSYNFRSKNTNLKIEQFLRKYPGVNCKATKTHGIEKREVQVTEDLVKSMRLDS